MKNSKDIKLTPEQYKPISSSYFNEGRKQENWTLGDILISGNSLSTVATMTSTYTSPTDSHGFHLSVFTALEIASQLQIIYAHTWADLSEKKKEGWMIECSNHYKSPIRNNMKMDIEMKVKKIRKIGSNLFCIADFKISDNTGGLFELHIKAIS
jgi:hypothetical protein